MIKFRLLLLLACFCFLSSFGQNEREKDAMVFANETYKFMEQYMENLKFIPNIKESCKDSNIEECITKFYNNFTSEEANFVNCELKKEVNKRWTSKSLPKSTIIKDTFLVKKDRDDFIKKTGQNLFVLSHPIFLRNYKYCILYEELICGNICGQGELILYEKENEKWIKKDYLSDWIH